MRTGFSLAQGCASLMLFHHVSLLQVGVNSIIPYTSQFYSIYLFFLSFYRKEVKIVRKCGRRKKKMWERWMTSSMTSRRVKNVTDTQKIISQNLWIFNRVDFSINILPILSFLGSYRQLLLPPIFYSFIFSDKHVH